jgi:hypothetical protein
LIVMVTRIMSMPFELSALWVARSYRPPGQSDWGPGLAIRWTPQSQIQSDAKERWLESYRIRELES